MAIVLESFAVTPLGTNTLDDSFAATKPTGTVEGNLLLCILNSDGPPSQTHTTPTGGATWLPVPLTAGGNLVDVDHGDTAGVTVSAWYKLANSSEPSTYTMDGSTGEQAVAGIFRFSGHDATTPIHKAATGVGNTASPVSPTVTTTLDNCVILRAYGADDGDATTDTGYPASTTGVYVRLSNASGLGRCNQGAAYTTLAAAGAAGTATFTNVLSSSNQWVGATIAIAPAIATGIAFDAATNSGYQAASSSYSWSHTCTGSNRYLVVGVSMLSLAQTVTSITYNSVALTLLGVQASISGACRVELWGLVAPTTGSNTIAVTLSGAIASAACASSYTGVHQTSSTEAFNSAQATNVGAADATVNVTTVADNDWCVDIVATDDTAITVGAGQTQAGNVTGAGGSGAMSYEGPKTPAGSVTMSWTNVAGLATWAIGSIALRPTAAAGLFIPRIIWFL